MRLENNTPEGNASQPRPVLQPYNSSTIPLTSLLITRCLHVYPSPPSPPSPPTLRTCSSDVEGIMAFQLRWKARHDSWPLPPVAPCSEREAETTEGRAALAHTWANPVRYCGMRVEQGGARGAEETRRERVRERCRQCSAGWCWDDRWVVTTAPACSATTSSCCGGCHQIASPTVHQPSRA